MKQALIALIRDTFTGKAADDQRIGKTDGTQTESTIRSLDLSELRHVAGGDGESPSPKRGWTA